MGTRQDRDCCCPCLVLFLSCTTRSNLSRSRLAHAPFHLPAPVTSSTAAAAAHVASSPQPPTVVVGCLQLEGRCNRPQSTQYSPHRNAVQPSTVCAAQRRAQERPSNRRNEREKEKKKRGCCYAVSTPSPAPGVAQAAQKGQGRAAGGKRRFQSASAKPNRVSSRRPVSFSSTNRRTGLCWLATRVLRAARLASEPESRGSGG